jgi:thiosulfate/3-mercaptopyruvate sulfurtransferase
MASSSPLISAPELKALLAGPGPTPVILDCSFDLTDPDAGARSHREGHIPHSRHVDLERDLSGPKVGADGRFRGRHPLRERAEYAALLGRWGIRPATPVIVCDRQGGVFAARLWWTLRWMGHTKVWLLDGGLAAWERAGRNLAAQGDDTVPDELPPPAPSYPTAPAQAPTLQADELLGRLGELRVIDARAPERFRGDVEPLDKVAGHIPGAVNRFFKDNLLADGSFKPAGQLHAEFFALLDGREAGSVVHQCGSGVTACHNLLAMEAAGFSGLTTLYPGSWSEWSARGDEHPKARGPL